MKAGNIGLTALRVFVAVLDDGGMSTAAKRLGVTRSAVTQTVATLEKSLGVSLLDRSTRPVAPTAAGRLLHDRGEAILEMVDDLENALRAMRNDAAPLRVGLVDSVGSVLGPWIACGMQQDLGTMVLSMGVTSTRLISQLKKAALDIGVLPLYDPRDFADSRIPLWSEPYWLVVPQSAGHDYPEGLQELANSLPYVGFSSGAYDDWQSSRILRSLGAQAVRRVQVESSGATIFLIAQGQGWAFAPPSTILAGRDYLSKVRTIRLPDIHAARVQNVVYRTPALRDVAELLAGKARALFERQVLCALRESRPELLDGVQLLG